MQELRHDSPDDDDGFLALLLEPLPEGSTERVVTHGAHGRKEESFAQSRGAGLAHGGLEEADRGFEITLVELGVVSPRISTFPESHCPKSPLCSPILKLFKWEEFPIHS